MLVFVNIIYQYIITGVDGGENSVVKYSLPKRFDILFI